VSDGTESTYEGRCQICEKGMESFEKLYIPKKEILPGKDGHPARVHIDCYILYLEKKILDQEKILDHTQKGLAEIREGLEKSVDTL